MTETELQAEIITVFVIDDDASIRRSLTRLLNTENYRVESFASADDFLKRKPYVGRGCILLDVSMPGLDGLSLQARLIKSGFNLPIVFLTGHGDIPTSVSAMKNGASDFLTKPVDENILLTSIADALSEYQQSYQSHQQENAVRMRLAMLTERELEVMRHVIAGERNKEIAEHLAISEKTVKAHRGKVMEKMAVTSIAMLVRICLENGIEAYEPENL